MHQIKLRDQGSARRAEGEIGPLAEFEAPRAQTALSAPGLRFAAQVGKAIVHAMGYGG